MADKHNKAMNLMMAGQPESHKLEKEVEDERRAFRWKQRDDLATEEKASARSKKKGGVGGVGALIEEE